MQPEQNQPQPEQQNSTPLSATPTPAQPQQVASQSSLQQYGTPQQGVPDEALKYVIPINVSGYAIAAGYIGLFAILILPAPLAVIFGILGLWDIKKHPGKRGKVRSWFAIILGSLIILAITAVSIADK